MAHSRVLLVLLVIAIIVPSLLLTSTVPVHASNITITPSSGTVGTTVHIEGSGFAGQLATVYWDNQSMLIKVPISEDGEFTLDFNAPADCKGTHTIRFIDDSNWTNSTASATFTVLPDISMFPSVGRPYSSITVTGRGFARLEKDIKVTWDKNVLPVSAAANYQGVWSVNFDAPAPDKGEYYISAFGSSTKESEIGEHKFIVGPFAKIQPSSGPCGDENYDRWVWLSHQRGRNHYYLGQSNNLVQSNSRHRWRVKYYVEHSDWYPRTSPGWRFWQ